MKDDLPLIIADNISVMRRGVDILRDVSLSVARHDFLTIVGPNGAGKTTLLKCLIGLIAPDCGTVRRTADLTVGYVPQRLSADDTLPISAGDFLTLCRRADSDAIMQAVEETAAAAVLHKPIHALSGGELQRVLMARALLDSPDLLVLDEPTQNLDSSAQLGFYELLERLYERRKIGILMVSHDLHLVMASTRRVVCLYHHICCSGEPRALAQDPEFINLLGNDMARMTAIYQHVHDHRHDHD